MKTFKEILNEAKSITWAEVLKHLKDTKVLGYI